MRLHAWRQYHAAELRGDVRLLPEALSLPDRVGELTAVLRDYGPDIVVADTLNAYFGRDENATQDMTAFVAAVRYLRDGLRCSVILIHHTGHADQSRERGSRVLRAAVDVIVQVARDESGSGAIGLQVIDARDMEPWDQPLALRLQPVDTDWLDDDGNPLTTCVVESSDQPVTLPGRGGKPLSESQQLVLDAVRHTHHR